MADVIIALYKSLKPINKQPEITEEIKRTYDLHIIA